MQAVAGEFAVSHSDAINDVGALLHRYARVESFKRDTSFWIRLVPICVKPIRYSNFLNCGDARPVVAGYCSNGGPRPLTPLALELHFT